MRCGLLGRKLGHSYSPQIHAMLGSYSYELFEVEPEALGSFLKNTDFQGLNVTVPYKKAVIPYLDALSPIAAQLGAVNTIVRRTDGTLIGHNTDYFGFETMLRASGLTVVGKKCLILGSGGASSTVRAVLHANGAKVIVISRGGPDNYENLNRHADAALIVNATPVGMYPNNGASALSLDAFPMLEGVLDVIYNPARTTLLLLAEARGLAAVNGLLMLVAQAKRSAEWFTSVPIDDGCIPPIYHTLRRGMENIILVGMPGCGKTTVGTLLAECLRRKFADADALIEENAGCTIPEIFAAEGEAGFRMQETRALAALGKMSGLVIATGGGCVTRPENYDLLHQNGTIIWLRRAVDFLPTNGRPLSQSGKLTEMYDVRHPLYEAFADFTVENDDTLSTTVSRILKILEV